MRHQKRTFKLGRESDHKNSLIANMLKALIYHERIETTVAKAKHLRRYADRMITLAKRNTLATKRLASGRLMINRNALTAKEARAAKAGDTSCYNVDRKVLSKLFAELGPRYTERQGGYTRIIKMNNRVGDNAPKCFIEFVK